eukprot:273801_1
MNINSSDLAEDDETQMIDKVDIIWPTMNLMKRIEDEYKKRFPRSRRSVSHFAFLSSQGFNESDLACASRMVFYEPTILPRIPFTLSPHIKTYTRLLNKEILRSNDTSSS